MDKAVRPAGGWLGVLDSETRAVLGQCASLALHLGLLAAAALSRPQLGATDEAAVAVTTSSYAVYHVTPAIAEQEVEAFTAPAALSLAGDADRLDEGGGVQAEPSEGKAGSSASRTAAGAIANQGPEDNLDVGPTRRAWADARTYYPFFGTTEAPVGDPRGLAVSREELGGDPEHVLGNMRSPAPAEASGLAGGDLAGTGQGGRGLACMGRRGGRGIGVSHVGRGGWTGAVKPVAPRPPTSPGWGTSGMRGGTSAPSPRPQDVDCDD